jgi:hypothetical protein
MDLAGIAALVSVPVALLTAVLPLRDRASLNRLERIDRLLRDTDLDADHAKLLRQVRRRLVRRVAAVEFGPSYTPAVVLMMAVVVICILSLVGIGIGALLDGDVTRTWLTFVAAAVLAGFFFLSIRILPNYRRRYADRDLPQMMRAGEFPEQN